MFRNNHPNNNLLYTKTMTFIQKNVAIANFLQQIPNNLSHVDKVNLLKNTIDQGKGDDLIFKDENCLMYLLYLIRNNQLEDNQALTLLTYLMGLKSHYNIEIIHINDDTNKDFKEKYIEAVIKKAKTINIQIDENKFKKEITQLTGVDAWVMLIKAPDVEIEISYLTQGVAGNTACLDANELKSVIFFKDETNRYGLLPSIEIIKKFVLQFNPYPIKYYPIFGIISLETLKILHTFGYHPVQLHGGMFVKNNLEKAHGAKASPFAVLIHDLYHAYSGCLLSKEEHVYLYQSLIPALSLQIKIFGNSRAYDKYFLPLLRIILNFLVDMDLGILIHKKLANQNNGQSLFQKWLSCNYELAINNLSVYHFYLPIIINFYYNLFNSTLNFSLDVFNDLSKIRIFTPIAHAVKATLTASKENLSNKVNMKAIETFCDKSDMNWLQNFSSLLQYSKTSTVFLNELESTKRDLYCELMNYGFIYIHDFSTFNEEDLMEIRNLVSIAIDKRNSLVNTASKSITTNTLSPSKKM